MPAPVRLAALTLLLGLSACSVQRPTPQPAPPIPANVPGPATQPSAPVQPSGTPAPGQTKAAPRTSASFAPPPGGPSHWDPGLAVYVLETADGVYYRQRTYYRFSGGWAWATSPDGPWQPTDSSGVPPGLGRMHP
ncbi:hypothetical protein [Pseudomonas typographi]|uniref:Lipoprotein n=1 Tax=Pseudomonas typographi TaxID=2715964 RepID=A0ABR7Z8I8_9PSED|nr:hypothetical protein [Pseudomonas typographi]MBD1554207.1 hypothetical protein [Pseudomonas typographi]MBD1601683.1 hypothetical protein [Pseudomonas typographi]